MDSVEVIGPGLVASKCALHEAIYVWNLTAALNAGCVPDLASNKSCLYHTQPTHVLQWSNTDNYYMYIGAQTGEWNLNSLQCTLYVTKK